MSKYWLILFATILAWLLIPACTSDTSISIDSEKEATERAIEYLGVDTADAFTKTTKIEVKKTSMDEKRMISLSGKDLSKSPQWLVEFSDLKFKYERDASLRDYSVFIDSSTGVLIEINSYSDKYGNPNTREKLSLDELINRLNRLNIQIKDSLCTEDMSLYEALRNCYWHPDDFLELSAYKHYGTSIFNKSIRPIWYIMMRGVIPALSTSAGDEMPDYATNSIIIAINAKTGKSLFEANIP